jgi:hypothetical protein
VDTDGGIKPDMAFLALLADVLRRILLVLPRALSFIHFFYLPSG